MNYLRQENKLKTFTLKKMENLDKFLQIKH